MIRKWRKTQQSRASISGGTALHESSHGHLNFCCSRTLRAEKDNRKKEQEARGAGVLSPTDKTREERGKSGACTRDMHAAAIIRLIIHAQIYQYICYIVAHVYKSVTYFFKAANYSVLTFLGYDFDAYVCTRLQEAVCIGVLFSS